MSAPQRFVQIIDFETDRIDEMRALAEEGEQRFTGRADGPTRRLVLKDRSRPNHYLVVIEFDSYEEAMRNNDAAAMATHRASVRQGATDWLQ